MPNLILQNKTCSKCLEPKSILLFNKSKTGIYGVRGDCKSCQAIVNNNYTLKNKVAINVKSKEYRKLNKEYFIKYRVDNKEKHKFYIKNRLKNDNLFRLSLNIRNLIRISFKRNNISKNSKTALILGCSYEDFKIHIESLWEPWMTWDNYGLYNGEINYGWDIDHIIPTSSASTEDEVLKLNHYTNLQPLCSYTNRYVKINKLN